MKKGLQWRIGNGEFIHVWSQPWLKNGIHPYVSPNPHNDNFNLKVADLIRHDLGAWKAYLVEENFNHSYAQRIKALPFLNTSKNDKLIWRFSPAGNYTMHSSYRNFMENFLNNDHLKVYSDCMLI